MTNEFHNTLNPKLWVNNKLKPEVASKLKEIADAFIESMEVPRNAIKDIVITGSSASYNYTPHSDIDLHLIVDFEKVHKDCPIVGDYLISKKSEFNNNHDIYIYGVPVEVYAEATDNENVHNGLYSLKDNRWIDEPKKLKPVDNDIAVNAKYKELAKAIEEVADKEESTQLMDKIKRMRKAGLAKEGEFSVENLVFKKLRNEGLIGKLADIKKQEIDKELSLEEAYERAISAIEEMCTSTVAMAPYSTPVVGQEQPTAPKKENRHKQKKAVLNYKYQKTWGTRGSEPVVEALMEEIGDVCENILDEIKRQKERKQAVVQASAKVLPEREKKLSDIVDKINASPRKDNALEKAKLIAQKKVNKAKKNLGFQVESLIESLIFEMGRHLKEINPEMYKKYKNMKFIDTNYYPDMPEETKKKVHDIQNQQKKYEDVVTAGELSGDKAMYNIGAGNLKRTQHQLQNLTRAERAEIFKSMGKALNRKIKKDYEERNK